MNIISYPALDCLFGDDQSLQFLLLEEQRGTKSHVLKDIYKMYYRITI